ncbi:hypothetical protein GS4_05_00010 [Gordonia soli NBRC 108243]|uniref:Glycoprotein n=2 Tax=Gordonia soli TaxID=320799 RepID=M0QDX4_9ACTN|nr:hypothetical protein GS4_05_00010 [Gordonia soli NBRC 108243]
MLLAAPVSSPAGADPGDDTSGSEVFAHVVIDSVTPSLVTSSSDATVTVAGRVENVGSRTLRDTTIRLERGDRVQSAAGLRRSLAVDHPPVAASDEFRQFDDLLEPGDSKPFSLSMPLSAPGGLGIDRTGVYPLQVNLNGVPEYGSLAQVGGTRTLLPVLSLPPDRARARAYVDPLEGSGDPDVGPDGSVSANTSSPSALTMLWPLAAPPQLAPGVLGGGTEPVRLISEDMARSVSPGGRLYRLLHALTPVVGAPEGDSSDASGASDGSSSAASAPSSASPGSSPPGSFPPTSTSAQDADADAPSAKLAQSTCLAVDPDLLVTVRAMSLGYVVTDDPENPRSPTTPGTGRDAADAWLTELRRVASKMCVTALPFAQADLDSLARIDDVGLTTAALATPSDVVDGILDVRSVRDLTIPAVGSVDPAGAGLLESSKRDRLVTAAGSVDPARGTQASGRYRIENLRAQTFDTPVSAALGAVGTAPTTPALTPADQRVALAGESPASRRQTATASLAYTAIAAPDRLASDGEPQRPQPLPITGRSQFVVPPTYWSPSDDDAAALLSTATVLLESGTARPAPLPDVVRDLDGVTDAARIVSPSGTATDARAAWVVDDRVAASIRRSAELSWRLQASLVSSEDVDVSPQRYVAPLREDLLRAVRSPDTLTPPARTVLTEQRSQRTEAVDATLQRMTGAVSILDPGGRYTLASERSPLLLVVRNDLALPVRVRIDTSAPTDFDVGDVGVIEIPARGTRQIQMPTRADSSEAITVTISMLTSSGVPLGVPISLSVHSNAYGMPLFIITICAGAALVLLTARRLWHRFRGEPDPADEDRPEPDEHERHLAGATYQVRQRTLRVEEPVVRPEPPEDDR